MTVAKLFSRVKEFRHKNEVSKVISPNDTMFDSGEDEYLRIGKLALDICKTHLKGRTPARILDFPSGYGRVMRWFKSEWPRAELFAAEIDTVALDFVESIFGARRVNGDHHLKMSIPSSMDLIFSGSLLTHLDQWQWDLFLEMCSNALAENGILVFTTHGRTAALLAKERHPIYGNLIDTHELYERYQETGFAFLPYSTAYPTFGLTLSSPEWIMRQIQRIPNIRIAAFDEGAWGQDVVVVQHNSWPLVA